MPDRQARYRWLQLQRALRRIGRSTGSAHQIAFGFSLGMFIAFTPTVGIQMILAAIAATALRCNRVAAILPVWISNPVTVVPIYLFNYWLGCMLLPGFKPKEARAENMLHLVVDGVSILRPSSVVAAFSRLAEMGWDLLLPLSLGSLIVGLVMATPAYFAARWMVLAFRRRLQKKRDDRATRIQALSDGPGTARDTDPQLTERLLASGSTSIDPATGRDDSASAVGEVGDDPTSRTHGVLDAPSEGQPLALTERRYESHRQAASDGTSETESPRPPKTPPGPESQASPAPPPSPPPHDMGGAPSAARRTTPAISSPVSPTPPSDFPSKT